MTSRAAGAKTRVRIIERALSLVHERGFQRTTLAEFAAAANVPTGNFYYYFKSKGDLGATLVGARLSEYRSLLDELDKALSAKKRLQRLIASKRASRNELTRYGCPLGSLTQELAKKGGPLSEKAGAIFDLLLNWTTRQFRAMGYTKGAAALAQQLIASLQGAVLLANALGRSGILLQETKRLSRWVEELPVSFADQEQPS